MHDCVESVDVYYAKYIVLTSNIEILNLCRRAHNFGTRILQFTRSTYLFCKIMGGSCLYGQLTIT